MMGLTRQWLETKPASTDKIKDGPAEFQARWKDLRELLNTAGITCDGVNPLADQGKMAVDASGTGINPTVYKADLATKLLEFLDAQANLLAGYKLIGSKNIPEATVDDGAVGVDAKGYKRALEPLRIWESNPVDTKVNVKAGIYQSNSGLRAAYFTGGNLLIGTAPVTLPAAGNHVYYAVVLNSGGGLTARKGTEDLLANPLTAPDVQLGDTPIALIEVKDLSVNFSLATSGDNAFLVQDWRAETVTSIMAFVQALQATLGGLTEGASVVTSKSITTGGGIVLAIGTAQGGTAGPLSVGRAGVPIGVGETSAVTLSGTVVGFEVIAAGTYTYQLRGHAAITGARLWLFELGAKVFA